MIKKVDRIIVDTNLWISFLIKKDHTRLDSRIKSGAVKIVFSTELIEEFLSVIHRPKFKPYFLKAHIESILDLFDFYGELHDVVSDVEVCRDKNDNFLLALAKDSQADYLLTGDKDLLMLNKFGPTQVVTISEYLNLNK